MFNGRALKHRRVELGLSAYQVAKQSQISQANISRLESGEQVNPNLKTILALASTLKVQPQYLIHF